MANTKNNHLSFSHLASSSEWRWVLSVSVVITLITSIPLFWALWTDVVQPDVHFMGIAYTPIDGATYLSKIELGRDGNWRTYFRHSPDANEGAYLDLLYTGVGNVLSRLGLSNAFIFHTVRLLTSFLMFFSLYQLAATIWRRIRNRRLFFVWVLVGSGFGWLLLLFGVPNAPDLAIPEAFPLYSTLVNAHFPLAFACLALLASIIVRVFRPGFREEPTVSNGGLTAFTCSLVLSVIAPHALVPFATAVALVIAFSWYTERQLSWWQFRWLMMLVLPASPVAFYYLAEVRYNPAVAAWSAQNVTLTPLPWVYLAGFGLPLLVALPGVYRAVRNFEPDGDQFMLLWLLSILVAVYLPVDVQRRFSIGLMIPVVYFAIRTLDMLLPHTTPTPRQERWVRLLIGASTLSYALLMLVGIVSVSDIKDQRLYLHDDTVRAVKWLATEAQSDTVALAPGPVSLWIPGMAGLRVVYAHPYETINAPLNEQMVTDWYAATVPDEPACIQMLDRFSIEYVLDAPSFSSACVEPLREVRQFGDVTVYAP